VGAKQDQVDDTFVYQHMVLLFNHPWYG